MRTALILGAGWSAAAGYPLARDLLAGPIYAVGDASRCRVQEVLDSYGAWAGSQRDAPAEVFLAEVRAGRILRRPDAESPTLLDTRGGEPLSWRWAVESVLLRLGSPVAGDPKSSLRDKVLLDTAHLNRRRYSANLSSPAASPSHTAFLRELIGRQQLTGVVTTNYDTLVERVLRQRPMRRSPEPGFYYGGLPRPQHARGHLPWDRFDPYFTGRPGELELIGTMPVYKLHGSVNWERGGEAIALFRDQRLLYKGGGIAAIIPPTPEKTAEAWLSGVWAGAEEVLRTSEHWVVVGYSLPAYDHAVTEVISRAAREGNLREVSLHDPSAVTLEARWREATGVPIECRPGLR